MEIIDISIGRISGEVHNMQIVAGSTVRELIFSYKMLAGILSGGVIYRLEFGGKLLRKDERIRDVGIESGAHITVLCKEFGEQDSDSSGCPMLVDSSSSEHGVQREDSSDSSW